MTGRKPPKHGPPGSLLRVLQRGTGGGYLRALKAPPEQVQLMLISFAEEDPSWDHQLESRDEYWGDIAVAVGMPAEPLGEIAIRMDRLDDDGNHDGDHQTALGMLGRMARRGRADALGALVAHVERGLSWDDAIRELEESGPAAMRLAADALARRFGTGLELRSALQRASPIWEQFEDLHGPVGVAARALRTEREHREKSPREPMANLADMTLDQLAAHAQDVASQDRIAHELRRRKVAFADIQSWIWRSSPGRVSEANFNGVTKTVRISGTNGAGVAALKAMEGIADSRVLPECVRLIESPRRPGSGLAPVRRQAMRMLQQAPASITLPIARRWWTLRRHRAHALDLFEVHGEPEDIQRIVPVLGMRFTPGTHYLLEGALDALAKHPQYGPFPGLESLYHRAAMSCTRERVVRLMALTEPGFGRGLAFECLWDAEPAARMAAVSSVDLTLPGVRERIEFLATDQLEWESNRQAAQERLNE